LLNVSAEIAIDAAGQLGEMFGVDVKAGGDRRSTNFQIQCDEFEMPPASKTEYRNLARKSTDLQLLHRMEEVNIPDATKNQYRNLARKCPMRRTLLISPRKSAGYQVHRAAFDTHRFIVSTERQCSARTAAVLLWISPQQGFQSTESPASIR